MKINEVIVPNKVPVGQGGPYLYHVTNEIALAHMLNDGKIGQPDDILSMTRDSQYSVSGKQGVIQIVLNRKNLESTHAVEPHEEIWTDAGEEWSSGESEERIWEHPVPFTTQYVVQVNSKIPLHNSIHEKLKYLNIPLGKF